MIINESENIQEIKNKWKTIINNSNWRRSCLWLVIKININFIIPILFKR